MIYRLQIRVRTVLPAIVFLASLAFAQDSYEIQVYGSETGVFPGATIM